MKERPILFMADMIRAILNTKPGLWPAEPIDTSKPFKWQTRRVIGEIAYKPKYPPTLWVYDPQRSPRTALAWRTLDNLCGAAICDYGIPGDHLWVKETWSYITKAENEFYDRIRPDGCPVEMIYRASIDYELPASWTSSIFMPRWASRIALEIKNIRVEQVQQIGEADCIAEGLHTRSTRDGTLYHWNVTAPAQNWWTDPVFAYQDLWDSINRKRGHGWSANPYAWVIEFMRLT